MTVIAVAMEIGTYDKRFGSCLAEDMGLELFDMRRLERDVAERNNASDGSIHQFIKHRIFGAKCSSAYRTSSSRRASKRRLWRTRSVAMYSFLAGVQLPCFDPYGMWFVSAFSRQCYGESGT
jgi:hypothetical protein